MDDAELLKAARQIRDETQVAGVREELTRLISTADDTAPEEARQEAIDQIYELFGRDEQARRRLHELVPQVPDEPRFSYEGLAGDSQFSDDGINRYVCPLGDYSWPVLDVDDPTPQPAACPNDGTPLVFRAAGN